jgi:hypothetical protein
MMTIHQLAMWLEDDGHAGCASDLMCAAPADRPRAAREVAGHCEADPVYDDGEARALPGELRAWAAEQEAVSAS